MLFFVGAFLFFNFTVSAEEAKVNKIAPDFEAVDTQGKTHKLSDFKGKTVVLEWSNPKCPYVKKHYKHDNMQAVQEKAHHGDIVWLTVLSSARGRPGYVKPKKAEEIFFKKYKSHSDVLLMDTEGVIGQQYGAKVTPHMYIIDKDGVLVYAGAIDDKPSARASSLKGAKNHVLAALSDMKQGKAISIAETRAYGCSVQY